jgi:hypothetical protein
VVPQPSPSLRHDNQHRHQLDEERCPSDPVEDDRHRIPRLANVGPLDEDDRDDEQRRDEHRDLEAGGDALGAFVHRALIDARRVLPVARAARRRLAV